MEERSRVDALGLLEDVLHGLGEAVSADGSASNDDLKPTPRGRSAVSSEVAEWKPEGLGHGMDAGGHIAKRVFGNSKLSDGVGTQLAKTRKRARELQVQATNGRVRKLAEKAGLPLSEVP